MRTASAQTHSRWEGVLVWGRGGGKGVSVGWCLVVSQPTCPVKPHILPLNTTATTASPLRLRAPPPQDFRKHLIGLTDVTHTSFDKLVAQLERGFEDMDT